MLLVRSLKIINKPDMLDIGAVADLRSYLNGQETVGLTSCPPTLSDLAIQGLRDILFDELHAHLYLKSFWCESRWSAYVPGQQICKVYLTFVFLPHLHHFLQSVGQSSKTGFVYPRILKHLCYPVSFKIWNSDQMILLLT